MPKLKKYTKKKQAPEETAAVAAAVVADEMKRKRQKFESPTSIVLVDLDHDAKDNHGNDDDADEASSQSTIQQYDDIGVIQPINNEGDSTISSPWTNIHFLLDTVARVVSPLAITADSTESTAASDCDVLREEINAFIEQYDVSASRLVDILGSSGSAMSPRDLRQFLAKTGSSAGAESVVHRAAVEFFTRIRVAKLQHSSTVKLSSEIIVPQLN